MSSFSSFHSQNRLTSDLIANYCLQMQADGPSTFPGPCLDQGGRHIKIRPRLMSALWLRRGHLGRQVKHKQPTIRGASVPDPRTLRPPGGQIRATSRAWAVGLTRLCPRVAGSKPTAVHLGPEGLPAVGWEDSGPDLPFPFTRSFCSHQITSYINAISGCWAGFF